MRYALIFISFFSLSCLLAQSEANEAFLAQIDTTMPYYVPSQINGFKNVQVMATPYASSTDAQQINWLLTVNPGTYFQIKDSTGNILTANSLILPGYTLTVFDQDSLPFGHDIFYPKEGPWSVVERILTTDSLQFWYQEQKIVAKKFADSLATEAKIDAIIAAQDAEIAKEKDVPWYTSVWKGIVFGLKIIGFLAFIVGLCLLFWWLFTLLQRLGLWLSNAFDNYLENKRQKAAEQTLENLDYGDPIDEAGPAQIPGGLGHYNAGQRLAEMAAIPYEFMAWFVPVKVNFLREVKIGYANHSVNFLPGKENDSKVFYLGKTNEKEPRFLLCAQRCGNSILGSDGSPIIPGIDFEITEVVKLPEVTAYEEALIVADRSKQTGQIDIDFK